MVSLDYYVEHWRGRLNMFLLMVWYDVAGVIILLLLLR